MSDGIPKSRVTLTYDTKQPEGREKPRELPFRLLVMGDLGGSKDVPFDERKVRQMNGRNLGEVVKGLQIKIKDVPLDDAESRKVDVLVDSLQSFSPDDVLRLVTGQKAEASAIDALLKQAWGEDATPETLWPGDEVLTKRWNDREAVVAFQKSYQNSKLLRAALKKFSAPPADDAEKEERKAAIAKLKTELESKVGASAGGAE